MIGLLTSHIFFLLFFSCEKSDNLLKQIVIFFSRLVQLYKYLCWYVTFFWSNTGCLLVLFYFSNKSLCGFFFKQDLCLLGIQYMCLFNNSCVNLVVCTCFFQHLSTLCSKRTQCGKVSTSAKCTCIFLFVVYISDHDEY